MTHGGSAPQVRAKAQERLADLIDPERALRTTAALAYSDVTELYDENYKLKPLKDWPPAIRQAIRRIEPRRANTDPNDGESEQVLRLEMHDKVKALEMLFDHLGLRKQRLDVEGTLDIRWQS